MLPSSEGEAIMTDMADRDRDELLAEPAISQYGSEYEALDPQSRVDVRVAWLVWILPRTLAPGSDIIKKTCHRWRISKATARRDYDQAMDSIEINLRDRDDLRHRLTAMISLACAMAVKNQEPRAILDAARTAAKHLHLDDLSDVERQDPDDIMTSLFRAAVDRVSEMTTEQKHQMQEAIMKSGSEDE